MLLTCSFNYRFEPSIKYSKKIIKIEKINKGFWPNLTILITSDSIKYSCHSVDVSNVKIGDSIGYEISEATNSDGLLYSDSVLKIQNAILTSSCDSM